MIAPLRSIRVRLTLWYVVLVAVILAVFCVVVYLALRTALWDNLNETLQDRTDTLAPLLIDDGELEVHDLELPSDPIEEEEFVRIYDSSGRAVFDNTGDELDAPPNDASVEAALDGRRSRRTIGTEEGDFRVLTRPVRAGSQVVGVIEMGLSEEDTRGTLRTLLVIILIAYPLTLVVTTAGGVFLATRALSPIDRVTRAAREITAEDLHRRLNLDLPDDEVGRLARTFDEMIARLDDAFARQRQFTADASHELRTPLTAIKGQVEVALQRPRDVAGYQEVLQTVNADVDRMIRLVGSLLTLARADSARAPLARERFDLRELVRDSVEQVRPAAQEKGLTMSYDASGDEVAIVADQDLVLQLVLNLLDNAVKYTPAGGVTVAVRSVGADGEISVSDTGPGIEAEHLPHIFDRFYRVDKARSRAVGGAGLGLSISKWIAEAHGGTIAAESTPGRGSTFVVRLPRG